MSGMQEGNEILWDVTYHLESLAKAFQRTGNEAVSQELNALSLMVQNGRKLINDDYGSLVSDYSNQAMQSSVNVLQAALAGCIAGAKGREGDLE